MDSDFGDEDELVGREQGDVRITDFGVSAGCLSTQTEELLATVARQQDR